VRSISIMLDKHDSFSARHTHTHTHTHTVTHCTIKIQMSALQRTEKIMLIQM